MAARKPEPKPAPESSDKPAGVGLPPSTPPAAEVPPPEAAAAAEPEPPPVEFVTLRIPLIPAERLTGRIPRQINTGGQEFLTLPEGYALRRLKEALIARGEKYTRKGPKGTGGAVQRTVETDWHTVRWLLGQIDAATEAADKLPEHMRAD